MRILIDTDIFLDILLKREPYFSASYRAIRHAIQQNTTCFLSAASALTLSHYLTQAGQPTQTVNLALRNIQRLVTFVEVKESDLALVSTSKLIDINYIAALFAASRVGADYILTRNPGWKQGRTPSLTPEEFVSLLPDT